MVSVSDVLPTTPSQAPSRIQPEVLQPSDCRREFAQGLHSVFLFHTRLRINKIYIQRLLLPVDTYYFSFAGQSLLFNHLERFLYKANNAYNARPAPAPRTGAPVAAAIPVAGTTLIDALPVAPVELVP